MNWTDPEIENFETWLTANFDELVKQQNKSIAGLLRIAFVAGYDMAVERWGGLEHDHEGNIYTNKEYKSG